MVIVAGYLGSVRYHVRELLDSLDEARESGLPMKVRYDNDTRGADLQYQIHLAGMGISFAQSRQFRLHQNDFDSAFDAYLKSIDMTRGTWVADNQVGRTRDLVHRAYRQEDPRIVLPPAAVPYMPMRIIPDENSLLGFLLVVE